MVKTVLVVLGLLVVRNASAQALSPASAPSVDQIVPASDWTAQAVFLSAAAADWASTYIVLSTGPAATEANPELAWLNGHPRAIVALGAGTDVVGVWLLQRFVGRHHPRVTSGALYLAAGFRVALTVRNLSRYRRAGY
jgi:hypothetical protein